MTRIANSKYKVSRKLGVSIWGSSKDSFNTKNYKPGQHGRGTVVNKTSDYGVHLRAKQRLKSHYGRVNEKQFKNTFSLAQKMKGNTAENLVGLLEKRLDIIVYRLGLASTIFAARQMVSHGHILVNEKRVNIPSQRLREGDVIELHHDSKNMKVVVESVASKARSIPDYLSFDPDSMKGKLIKTAVVSDVPYPFDPEIHLVVEFYSK